MDFRYCSYSVITANKASFGDERSVQSSAENPALRECGIPDESGSGADWQVPIGQLSPGFRDDPKLYLKPQNARS
jgi:hypothetical protein